MKKNIRFWFILSAVLTLLIISVLTVFFIFFYRQTIALVEENEQEILFNIGDEVIVNPIVQEALLAETTNDELTAYTQHLTENFELDYIVVMTMDGLRLSHPSQSEINETFVGGDESPAFAGERFASIGEGTLGESMRVFLPVFVEEEQVGVVALGLTLTSMTQITNQTIQTYAFSLGLCVLLGITGSILMAFALKKQWNDMGPREIAQLSEERKAMLNLTKDAIFVTNMAGKITITNLASEDMIQQDSEPNLTIQELLPVDSIDYTKQEQLFRWRNRDYILSLAPILIKNRHSGYIYFLKDAAEISRLTDQLYTTNTYATVLQNHSHEFMNKLHVIYGLVDLEDYEGLKEYLEAILEPSQELSYRLTYLVKDPGVAAFLLGEYQKFQEKDMVLFLEISPAIPLFKNQQDVQTWIAILNHIHQQFIQKLLAKTLFLQITWEEDQLITRYEIEHLNEDTDSFTQQLESRYFLALLKELSDRITFTVEKQEKIVILFTYRLEENGHESFNR